MVKLPIDAIVSEQNMDADAMRMANILDTYNSLKVQRDKRYNKMVAHTTSPEMILKANAWYEQATENIKEWFQKSLASFAKEA